MNEAAAAAARTIGGIPIRNLYVMLAFADRLRDELSDATCGVIDNTELPLDILAHLLTAKLAWIRRRGTPRRYRVREDVGAMPEGTIDFAATLRGGHLLHDRLAYRVDELQLDTPQNQLLCAGIRALVRASNVDASLRAELRRHLGMFSGVSYISNREALRVEWRKRDAAYSSYNEALALARLALLQTLPDEGAHTEHWRRLLDDQKGMGELFERFLRGFLNFAFGARGHVRKRRFRWMDGDPSGLLPTLETDLFIELPERICVGECKLYKSPLVIGRFGDERLHSDHLNQHYAYLRAAQARYPEHEVTGLLVYGLVDRCFDTDVCLREHVVQVRTVDLYLEWPLLREQLVRLWPTATTDRPVR